LWCGATAARPAGKPTRPLGSAPGECVAVDGLLDAGNLARRGERPQGPGVVPVMLLRLCRDAPDPVGIGVEGAFEHLLVEGDVGVDDGALARMPFQGVDHHLYLRPCLRGRDLVWAGSGIAVPLEFENGSLLDVLIGECQASGVNRHRRLLPRERGTTVWFSDPKWEFGGGTTSTHDDTLTP
jgi:hypothetical protein